MQRVPFTVIFREPTVRVLAPSGHYLERLFSPADPCCVRVRTARTFWLTEAHAVRYVQEQE